MGGVVVPKQYSVKTPATGWWARPAPSRLSETDHGGSDGPHSESAGLLGGMAQCPLISDRPLDRGEDWT